MDKYSNIQKRNKRRYILSLFAMTASVLSLTVTSFAWFIFNRNNSVTNSEVIVADQFAHQFTYTVDGQSPLNNELHFAAIFPGQVHTRNLSFTLKNTSNNPYQADIYLKATSNDQEVAYFDDQDKWNVDDLYYYLGSQIQISDITLTIDGIQPSYLSGEGTYLLTTTSVGVTKGQVNGVSAPLDVTPRLELLKNVLIPVNKTLVGSIDFTFVDNGTDQSMYMEDWPLVGTCSRFLEGYLHPED
jgi:hypothetical protein